MRDYGTATWAGSDANCDHIDVAASNVKNRLAGSHSGDITNRTTEIQSSSDRATVHYRDLCGKCGARRIDRQIGLEGTPDAYVAKMVAVFREVRRVLRPDGTCWVNLGDSYAAHGMEGGTNSKENGRRADRMVSGLDKRGIPGLKPKDLVGIPWRVAFALQADGWYLRSDCIEQVELYCPCGCGHVMEERIWRYPTDREIIWHKPNPMPESVRDRPTKSHEYMFLLTKRARYYYDADAVRERHQEIRSFRGKEAKTVYRGAISGGADNRYAPGRCGYGQSEAGRNLRSVWTITPKPFRGAHFATFAPALVERCVKAGTSERGACPTCGAPWERVTEHENMIIDRSARTHSKGQTRASGTMLRPASTLTIGWRPTCSCPAAKPVPCVVLDPFVGSGTTIVVSNALGRHAIGCDLSAEYLGQAKRRIERPHQPGVRQREKPMPLFDHVEDIEP